MGDMVMGECENRPRKSCIAQTYCKFSKEDMENYNWVMFIDAMDFFKKCGNLKKPILEHFFTSLLNDLSTKDLVMLGIMFSTKFMKP